MSKKHIIEKIINLYDWSPNWNPTWDSTIGNMISNILDEYTSDLQSQLTEANKKIEQLTAENENFKCCGNCGRFDFEISECYYHEKHYDADQVCEKWDSDLYSKEDRLQTT